MNGPFKGPMVFSMHGNNKIIKNKFENQVKISIIKN
jgi:hypothetical protein